MAQEVRLVLFDMLDEVEAVMRELLLISESPIEEEEAKERLFHELLKWLSSKKTITSPQRCKAGL